MLFRSGSIDIAGPFAIAENGVLTATIEVTATDLDAVVDFVAAFLRQQPEQQRQLRDAAALLSAAGFGRSGTNSLTLTVEHGAMRAGIIALGELPPLF